MRDAQYTQLPRPGRGLVHAYGPRVHLLSFPYPMTLLARLCDEDTRQPEVNHLVAACYDWMLAEVGSQALRTRQLEVNTRMRSLHPEGVVSGEGIDPDQRVVVVDVARAGVLPSLRLYHGLHHVVRAENLRQDHVVASRTTDGDGRVTGVRIDSSKIGGPVAGATLMIPDPMAATGTSLAEVIGLYNDSEGGPPLRVVALHLIVTPEYLRRMTRDFPDMDIFALRLDRGLSPPDVLTGAVPGERWSEEKGLNDQHYIVPGAGGVGEVLNNAWV